MPTRVAIIGSGISGLSAAWLLYKDPSFSPTLYESGSYPGGHTHTVDIPTLSDPTKTVPVDTGFIVCNPVTYPNFLALLKELQVPLATTDMSFSVSRNGGEFEWCGDNIDTVFAQRRNLMPFGQNGGSMWRMILDIIRFHNEAKRVAVEADRLAFDDEGRVRAGTTPQQREHPLANLTLAEFFKQRNYSSFFYENYIVPMTAAIWSTPADMTFDKFPVLTLLRFMRNHQLLQIGRRPKWRTVIDGSRTYVTKILESVTDVRLNTAVVSVERQKDGKLIVVDASGNRETYDHVVLATHTDQALKILGESATSEERKILGSIKYLKNRLVLHRDPELMPKSRKAWAAWNYLTRTNSETESPTVCLTYWMNRLQPFVKEAECGPVFATLNPLIEPRSDMVFGEWEYEHPLYAPQTIAAQEKLQEIQNKNGVTFCGAWTNYGFHEDGLTSGLLASISLGATCPFPVHLNGGYPTERLPISPPSWATEKGVTIYTPAKPKYIEHTAEAVLKAQRRSDPILEVLTIAFVVIFALICLWIALWLDLGRF
ncbi:hypothetical protein SpCBS45565_g07091 [Spizellomyces sp. 'palustris']|nr:hypothetical protein SpCBS45565_g07091 [Spizellomyces sp. 'palustris']